MIYLKNILRFCLLLFFLSSCKEHKNNSLRFVQLCDTQLGMGGYNHDKMTFTQALQQIDALKVDFFTICGDLVHEALDSTYQDFEKILRKSNTPYFLAPGNHDVDNIPNVLSLSYYRRKIGKDYYTFNKVNTNFIVTNTQLWKVDVEDESEKHHNWFLSTIDSLGKLNQPIFVIGHYPLFIESPDEKEAYFNLPKGKRIKILEALVKNKTKAYLSGHTHKLLLNEYKNVQLVSGETTSKNFDNRHLGFRLWKVSQNSIQHQFIALKNLN